MDINTQIKEEIELEEEWIAIMNSEIPEEFLCSEEKETLVPAMDSDIQIDTIIKFLKVVHPWLNSDAYTEKAVELRAIARKEGLYARPLNLYRLDAKGINYLRKWLKELNGQPFCLYWSIRTLDPKIKKGTITKENALFTQNLVLDLDHCSSKQYNTYLNTLENVGLIPSVVVFTGHGYQLTFHLSTSIDKEDLISKILDMLYIKGINHIDLSTWDRPRVMRLPATRNNKNWTTGESIETELISTTECTYTLKNIVEAISKIPNVNTVEDLRAFKSKKPNKQIEGQHTLEDIESVEYSYESVDEHKEPISIEVKLVDIAAGLEDRYSFINTNMLIEPVKRMLSNTPDGFKNKVMMFLIPYFKNSMGYSKSTILEIMEEWVKTAENSKELNVVKEVNRLYSYEFNGKYGTYADLARKFGYIETFYRDNTVKIPQTFINSFTKLTDGAVRIYLAMLTQNKLFGTKEFTKVDIQDCANISERTLERDIKCLVKEGFVDKVKTNRRLGEKYLYYINVFAFTTEQDKGFILIDTALVRTMINDRKIALTPGEMKVYTYLVVLNGLGKIIYPSRTNIADKVDKTVTAITKITNSLEEKGYIAKRIEKHGNISKNIYRLNL